MGGAVVGLGALDDIGDVVLVGAELDINLRGERGTTAPLCSTRRFALLRLCRRSLRSSDSYFIALAYSFGVGLVLGGSLFIFGRQFLALFTTEGAVIDAGMKRVGVMGFAYCISAFMDCTIAASRGLGKTVVPTVIVVLGSCVFRVIWVYTIFAHFHTIPSLYLLYPCSWTLTAIAEIVYFIHAYKDSMKIFTQPQPAEV